MINKQLRKAAGVLMALALVIGLIPISTYAISGTIHFTGIDGSTTGDTVTDGQTGSVAASDIPGIDIDIFGSNDKTTKVGNFIYLDFQNVITPSDVPAYTYNYIVIQSRDGTNFSLQSIYINNCNMTEDAVHVEGILDGATQGTVNLTLDSGGMPSQFNSFNGLTASIFQNVDKIVISSNTVSATDVTAGIGDIQIGDPVLPNPTITSATYDAGTGALAVTGTNLAANSGAANDIDASKLTLTGEGGTTYTLTDTADVELTSSTAFTVTLSATDKAAVNQVLNKNGTASTGGTTYNLAAADDWAPGANAAADISDATNAVTVSSVAAPAITSATYDHNSGVLAVTGTDFLKLAGGANDIDVSMLSFVGEGGNSYTLTSSDVEITSGTQFSVTLNTADQLNASYVLNKNGTSSGDGTTYNLAAAEDWAKGADAAVAVADTTGNGITVSNVTAPAITGASYNGGTGALTVAGTNIPPKTGAGNDIDASKLTVTGEGGATYTLTDTADAEITSGTQFTVTLSPADKAAVDLLLNKNGTSSLTSGTTYNLAAAEDWAAGADAAVNVADLTGNGITVSNVPIPTITSAAYDADTGSLIVTGTNLVANSGAANDIDASKLTITGEGGTTYTLTDTADVELTSSTAFTVVLSATDKAAVNQMLNKNGTASTGGTAYNLAAADDWAPGADAAPDISDAVNAVIVSNVAAPAITSAAYDASTGALVVTGTGFLSKSGAANDIDTSKLTIAGEGGAACTLTDSADVEITGGTSFTVTLSPADQAAVNLILNKNGTSSTSGTTYNLAAAEDWAAGADAAVNVADLTGNGISVSNVPVPAITSAAYDADTGTFVVTGTGLLSRSGAANDIDASMLTVTGEGGTAYTLTDTADVEITSGIAFTVTLSTTDKAAVNQILNKNGTASTGGTTYNLAAAEDWAAGADAAVTVADLTGNGIVVSNVPIPMITSATYDVTTGALVVTGTNFLSKSGAANDIDTSMLTITGEGGTTYTLTDTADVEITSGTQFTVTLSATDKAAVNQILNKNGTASTGGTTYNLAAAEDWAAGADAAVTVADLTGNGITVSNIASSGSTGGSGGLNTSLVVEVNGEKQDAGTSTTQTVGSQIITTITIDDAKLDKILEAGGEKPTVTLPSTGADVTVGELNGQTVKNMEAKEATLEIKTETVTYTLPASQINIDNVSSQIGSQVELKDIKVSVKIAEPSADTVKIVEDTANKNNFQIVVTPIAFEITCTSGGKTIEVSKFNGYVERTVAIPDGIDPSKITTGIVLNSDGTFSHVPTQIVNIDGKYYAKISSLTNSTYSVIYNPVSFADVTNHWAKDAINDMGSRMVVTGMGDGLYEPDRSITRAEFAAIVVRAMGLQKGTAESAFGDVASTDWYCGYVETAAEYGLITGYPDGTFGPNDKITREQAMTILVRAMKLTGLGADLTESEMSALLENYTDAGSVSDYAKAAATVCIKAGVVTGTTATTISPKDYVTRAEVAVMVQRLLQKSGLI